MVDFSWIKKTPIAHRGLHNEEAPENSLLSFELAIAEKVAIELDIQLTKDGEIIVFHDDDLKRLCQKPSFIRDSFSRELMEQKIGGTSQKIPSLKKVLSLVQGSVPLLIEVKCRHFEGKLERALFEELKNYKGKVAIQSFNPRSVYYLKKLLKDIPVGMLSGHTNVLKIGYFKGKLIQNLLLYPFIRADFISYQWDAIDLKAPRFLRKVMGIPLIVWTIDELASFEKVVDHCDNIIFEGSSVLALLQKKV